MSLGQSLPAAIAEQGGVVEIRRVQTQSFVNQQLAGGRDQQVLAADDFGDAHRGIVDHHREFIGGEPVLAPDDEIAEVAQAVEGAGAEVAVVERYPAVAGHAKTPIRVAGRLGDFAGSQRRAQMFGVNGVAICLVVVRRLGGPRDIFARFVAGVNIAGVFEMSPCIEKAWQPFALMIRCESAAYIGPFVPIAAEPAQVFECGCGVFRLAALGVEVLVAVHQLAAGLAGALHRDPKGACMAEVQITGRGWGDAASVGRFHAI